MATNLPAIGAVQEIVSGFKNRLMAIATSNVSLQCTTAYPESITKVGIP